MVWTLPQISCMNKARKWHSRDLLENIEAAWNPLVKSILSGFCNIVIFFNFR